MRENLLHRIKSFVINLPLLRWLRRGYPDEARFIAQVDTFKRVLAGYEFSGRCLDAGCGEGLYKRFLESFMEITDIVNLDINLCHIPREREKYPRLSFVRASLTHLPFADNTFNCCLCSEVLEHIGEDTVAISELGRVINQGGLLLISVPLPFAPRIPGHIRRGFSFERLSALLTENGFVIRKHYYCFYIFMRVLINFWQWQFFVLGRSKRTYLPRFFILILGYLDRHLRIGKAWGLVILAQRCLFE